MSDLKDSKGSDLIWRRIKVSNAMRLDILQDRILLPTLGWVRNYHVGFYTDRTDGALIGPIETGHHEVAHMNMMFYEFMDEKKYTLADFLEKEGDSLGWCYDLGDHWRHEITVEKVVPAAESNGKFELLNGSGACPGEDMKGNVAWGMKLEELKTQTRAQSRGLMDEIANCLNYRNDLATASPLWIFDPVRFNVKEARNRVQQALCSFSSEPLGPKTFGFSPGMMGFQGLKSCSIMEPMESSYRGNIPGSKEVRQCMHDGSALFEYIRFIEPQDMQICENCGKPDGLQRCSRCRNRSYCSKECQVKRWKDHRKICQAPQTA
ncbi:MM3350-like domain-containing protein [Peziza echinospora]|nr:MM3350-like domain-containing protein [Peziza echinospora]